MIITKKKDIATLKKALGPAKKVYIVGCGSCATACKTGGENEARELSQTLTSMGYTVTGLCIVDETCHKQLVRRDLLKAKKEVGQAERIIVLSCGSGVQAVGDALDVIPVPGCDTLFHATTQRVGQFVETCVQCGECVNDAFQSLCPLSRCAKGILNGPCGGMDAGKCESDRTKDCVFVLISQKRSNAGLSLVTPYVPPKDHSKKQGGQSLVV